MVSKREDPNYQQVSGHVPADVAMDFKAACIRRGVSQSTGLEQSLNLWLATTPDTDKPKRIRRPKESAQPTEFTTLQQAIADNLSKLRRAGIRNLEPLSLGEVLPTKADFAEIASILKFDADTQRRLWEQTFNHSHHNDEVKNGGHS